MAILTGINKVKTAVFISGNGSNLRSLIKFSRSTKSPISIKLIISNNSKAKGLSYGKIFRIKDKGVKSIRSSSNGDLYCRVHVETPINLTSEQEGLIRELDESLTGDNKNHRPKEKTWMDSIKDFFE